MGTLKLSTQPATCSLVRTISESYTSAKFAVYWNYDNNKLIIKLKFKRKIEMETSLYYTFELDRVHKVKILQSRARTSSRD